jgi:hypothetical protein
VAAIKRRRADGKPVLVMLSFAALHFAAYSLLNVPDYHWYFAPYAVFLLVAAGYAVSRWKMKSLVADAAIAVAGVAAVCFVAFPKAPRAEERFELYKEAGQYIAAHPPRNALGLMEIGIVGFFAPRVRVFDFSGIVTPEQIDRVKRSAANEWLTDPNSADKVLIRAAKHPLEPDFDPRFPDLYRLEWKTTTSPMFPNGLQIWELEN